MTATTTTIIPCFNASAWIDRAIESAMQQYYEGHTIIVIDDGSTDDTVERVSRWQSLNLTLLTQANAGKSVALNRALREVTTDYYCILDADDEMHPERIAQQVAALEANPDVAAVFCGHQLLFGKRKLAPRLRFKDRDECERDIKAMRMPAHDPTGMYRVSMVRDIEYEPSLRIGQGYDYILRVGERWPMMVLGECLYSYRVHPNSITRQNVLKRHAAVELVRRRAAERRGVAVEALEAPNPIRNRHRDNNLPAHFLESVVDLRRIGHNLSALKTAAHCAMLHPFDHDYYKPLAAALLPQRVLRRLRRREREDTPT